MGKYRKFLIMALAAGLVTALMASGVLDYADLAVSDRFYQSRSASDGEIVLVGIDQKALEDIGPYSQWGREVMAAALAALNESEACRPAVIAMDVLYSGETDGAGDARLAEEAGRYGNVVAACAAVFGSSLAEAETGEYYLDNFSVIAFDAPYEALGEAAEQGHINAMLDRDGILRHHLLEIGLEDGRRVPSLALKTAEMYREYHGMEQGALPPADARGFWYLPFCGVPGDMEAISLSDVLSGKVPADYFAGKIVLIGPYAAGLQDSYLTAADHAAPMYGMEFQANAIQALLWEDYRREVPDGIQLTALFFLLLLALAGFWKRKVRLSTGLWLLLCAGAVGFCRLMYDRGLVLHLLWIPLGVTALYVGCIAFNYMQASLEKRRITNTFERYVAPEIVREILREGTGGLELGGKLTRIAVLFVDVRGFTPMSERLKPTQVVEILNCYLSLISDCILKNGGTLDKFVGDAAMAPEELYSDTGNYRGPNGGLSGYEWLQLLKKKYKKIVWLNPKMAPGRAPWREAETAVKELFPMYKLTVDGLNQAMVKLMANR